MILSQIVFQKQMSYSRGYWDRFVYSRSVRHSVTCRQVAFLCRGEFFVIVLKYLHTLIQ